MNINIFTGTPFQDWEAFDEFLGSHEIAHQTISSKLIQLGRQAIRYPLTDSPYEDNSWMLFHYTMHQEIAKAINLSVPDLSAYDLNDETQFNDFMILHGQMHAQIDSSLGINT